MVALPEVNEVFADRYKILSPLGQGGMGAVFRVRDLQTSDTVALKMLHPKAMKENQIRERFEREIRIMEQLKHPNIVGILANGEWGEFPYFTMELIIGPNLLAFVDADDPLPLNQALYLTGQIASALNYAHGIGVIHRDLKPTNIIIQDSKTVKLLDFGLAREQEDMALTLPGQALGTAAYMAPEVGRGEKASPAADLYALGCLFFQLVTGRLPFVAESSLDIILQHQNAPPPLLSNFRGGIPPYVEEAVVRALAKQPGDRFRTAQEFYESLATPPEKRVASADKMPSFESFEQTVPDSDPNIQAVTEWQVTHSEAIPTVGVLGGWCVVPSSNVGLLAVGADSVEGPMLYDTGAKKWSRLGPHGAGMGVRAICWSRSGELLAFVNSQRLAIVNMAQNKCLARLDVSNHRPWKVDFLPDNPASPSVILCGESGGVIVWRDWPNKAPEVFRAHASVARALRVSPGGGTYVTGGLDGALHFWKSRNSDKRGSLKQKNAAFWDVIFSRTGEYLAAASSDRDLPVLVYQSSGSTFEGQQVNSVGRALCLAFSESERMLAVGGENGVNFLERQGAQWILTEKCALDGEVRGVCFSRGDRTVYAVTSRGTLVGLRRGHSLTHGPMFEPAITSSGSVVPPSVS